MASLAGFEEATIAQLQAAMTAGHVSARELVEWYLQRIATLDATGPTLRSVIETNPDALDSANTLDRERATGQVRGALHGIPILLKDNIDTADRMRTTAGSLALMDARPARDAFTAERLRMAGAVLLGKANLSEWANFRSSRSNSGWSARGGQCRNPYALNRSPCGSSSGSAVAVAANLAAASLGTETDGSILCPAGINGVVGIKPTLGLTSRAGVIPIAHSQDTVGPFGRTVADAAAVLTAIAGPDPRDPATAILAGQPQVDYTQHLDCNALRGARIGVAREVYFGNSEKADAVAEAAIQVLRAQGATIVDPANIPTAKAMRDSNDELTVLLYEFKADLNAYLAGLGGQPAARSLADLIAFNQAHAGAEMPFFGQEAFLDAQEKGPLTDVAYLEALANNRRLAREEGIDAVLREHQLDALLMPTTGPAWTVDHVNGDHVLGGSSQPGALAGYPSVSVPAGFVFGLPLGVTFLGTAFNEPRLIALAYAFEQASHARQAPAFVPAV